MGDEQILSVVSNLVNNLETKLEGTIQKEIKNGMDLISAKVNSSVMEREQKTIASLARIEENIKKKDKEITQLFTFVNEILIMVGNNVWYRWLSSLR